MKGFGVSNARKFLVLTWKTLLVKARHYIETVLDLIVPSLLFIVLVVLRYQFDGLAPTHEDAVISPKDEIFDSSFCGSQNYAHNFILYAPSVKATDDIMEKMKKSLEYWQQHEDCDKLKIGKLHFFLHNFNIHM